MKMCIRRVAVKIIKKAQIGKQYTDEYGVSHLQKQ